MPERARIARKARVGEMNSRLAGYLMRKRLVVSKKPSTGVLLPCSAVFAVFTAKK